MDDRDERYEDCIVCQERFVGEFIRGYIRYIEVPGGVEEICISCLIDRNKGKLKIKET